MKTVTKNFRIHERKRIERFAFFNNKLYFLIDSPYFNAVVIFIKHISNCKNKNNYNLKFLHSIEMYFLLFYSFYFFITSYLLNLLLNMKFD